MQTVTCRTISLARIGRVGNIERWIRKSNYTRMLAVAVQTHQCNQIIFPKAEQRKIRCLGFSIRGIPRESPSSIHSFSLVSNIVLTLNVRAPSYLGLTTSISWLLMPWLLMSPAHQQPWYWPCRIGRFLSYLRKNFNYLRRTNVEKWHKM